MLELSDDTELKGNLNNKDFTTVKAAEAALEEYFGDEERWLYEITRYINNVNREYTQVLMERDGSGALSTAYVYGNERLSVRSTKKESGYYLYDGRGPVTGIVSILGEWLESYSYDPSGQAMRATSTNRYQKTFYGYNAESYDPKTGSVYLRARYYNTRTGSFTTKDTYLGDLMEPLSLNRYSYTWGNPVNFIDPSGLEKIVVSGGIYSTPEGHDNANSNKFNFIAPAIKLLSEYAGEDETITWIIADVGWSDADKLDFMTIFADAFGNVHYNQSQTDGYYPDVKVNIIFIDNTSELINYLNAKDTNGGDNTSRLEDQITEFTVFSHGRSWDCGSNVALGYTYGSRNEQLDITKEDISKISQEAFAEGSYSAFYSCNAAIGVEGSFAQMWSIMTGGTVLGFNGKTDYSGIYSGWERTSVFTKIERRLGFLDKRGASDYPTPGFQNHQDGEELKPTETIIFENGTVVK